MSVQYKEIAWKLQLISPAAAVSVAHCPHSARSAVCATSSSFRRREGSTLLCDPCTDINAPECTVGSTTAAGDAVAGDAGGRVPISQVDPQPRHPAIPPDLPQYWDPMPEGDEVHEVVIYNNTGGATLQ